MYLRILRRDLKRKRTMNLILLLFIVLATMFAASSVNNIISVTTALDNYLEMAEAPDYFGATMNKAGGGNLKEAFEGMESVASYRTEFTGTTPEEMKEYVDTLKDAGFEFQDFYDFGISEEDMLSTNGWWGTDGSIYVSMSCYDGKLTIDHTTELPDLEGLFG